MPAVLLLFLSFASPLCLITPPARAMTIVNNPNEKVTGLLTISPTSIEINAAPGGAASNNVTIANRTGNPIIVDFSSEDFEGSQNPDIPTVLLGAVASPAGARDWLKPEVNGLALNQGDTATLRVSTTIPAAASPGGHYAVFLASFKTQVKASSGADVNMVSRVGCFFLVKVAGAANEQGSLNPPETPFISLISPVGIGLVFNNKGNIHLKPSGTIRVKNMLGMTVAEMPVSQWTVMPGSSRRTNSSWESGFMFGRYTVEADMNYGSEGKTAVALSSFWAFSWWLLLVLFILLVIVAALLFARRRRRSGREGPDAAQVQPRRAQSAAGPSSEPGSHAVINEAHADDFDVKKYSVDDPDSLQFLQSQIAHKLSEATRLASQGRTDEARADLEKMRHAALEMKMWPQVVEIDNVLLKLS